MFKLLVLLFVIYIYTTIVKNYNVIINGNNLYDQSANFKIKHCKEIRRLTTGKVRRILQVLSRIMKLVVNRFIGTIFNWEQAKPKKSFP